MALSRCSLPNRRYSSGLIDILKTATTVNPSNARDSTPGNSAPQPNEAGKSTPVRGLSAWDPISEFLGNAQKRTRADTLVRFNEPPEDAWKRRSEFINSQLRTMGMTNVGTRPSVTAQSMRMKGPAAYDTTGASEAEVPSVASGRTVTSGDFGRAIRKLNQILQRNRVKQEWRRDKYYTKPFQLRYQLRSRRHRQRFAAAIRRSVQIVQAIKRRGM